MKKDKKLDERIVVKFKLRKRQPFFTFVKGILKIFNKKPKIINLGGELQPKSILIPNHCHKKGPIRYEMYFPLKHAMWGAHEMLGPFKSRQAYLRDVFYIQKRGFSRRKASFLAAFEATLSPMPYKGMRALPTFTDGRLKDTIKTSMEVLDKNVSVMIFPEDSSKGYFDVLTGFFPGFVLLAQSYYKKTGEDVPVYPIYYHMKKNIILIDKPCYVQDYVKQGLDRQQIADEFMKKVNALYYICEKEY